MSITFPVSARRRRVTFGTAAKLDERANDEATFGMPKVSRLPTPRRTCGHKD
jgi:hypothetical protein